MIPIQKTLSAIIVDDEEEACNNLRNILYKFVNKPVEILGVATNTKAAEILINHHKPDVVFLDVDMPQESGFAFLERIQLISFEIVFVTAYDEYAIKAFRLNAIDYILKPINLSELNNAVQKLYERCHFKQMTDGQSFRSLPEQISSREPSCIRLRDGHEIVPVGFKDLLYFEARGSYSNIVFLKDTVEKNIIMGYPLAEYEELLPVNQFYRIHKSYLINCIHIHRLLKEENPFVVLKNGLKLPVGRRRYHGFLAFIQSENI
jgi:two-component system LytT family response regulator